MRVFLSCLSEEAEAIQLKNAIEARGEITVTMAPERFRTDGYWPPEMAETVRNADAILLLFGGRPDPWQQMAIFEALDRQRHDATFPIVPVISGTQEARIPFLNGLPCFNLRFPFSEHDLDVISAALSRHVCLLKDQNAWTRFNPYRGFQPLTAADGAFIFGRQNDTARLLELVHDHPANVIALVGDSGVGKTSLVQAGLIATLLQQNWPSAQYRDWPARFKDSRHWFYLKIELGPDPSSDLLHGIIEQCLPDPVISKHRGEIDEWLAHTEEIIASTDIIDSIFGFLEGEGFMQPKGLCLFVDQIEGLYCSAPDDRQQAFSEWLSRTAQRDDTIVLTSLRSDYYEVFEGDEALFPCSKLMNVPPLTRDALCEVIRKPAAKFNVTFESNAIVEIVVDAAISQQCALPLIADLLRETWTDMQRRGPECQCSGMLTWADRPEFLTAGQPNGDLNDLVQVDFGSTLRARANAFVEANKNREQVILGLLASKMANYVADGDPIAKRVRRSEFDENEWSILESMAAPENCLVSISGSNAHQTAKVAHEVLFREWPALKRWLEDEQNFQDWKREFEGDLRTHNAANTEIRSKTLLTGLALDRAEHWRGERPFELDQTAHRLIAASTRNRNEQNEIALREADALIVVERSKTTKERERAAAIKHRADAAEQANRRQSIRWRFGLAAAVALVGAVSYGLSRPEVSGNDLRIFLADLIHGADQDQRLAGRERQSELAELEVIGQAQQAERFGHPEGASTKANSIEVRLEELKHSLENATREFAKETAEKAVSARLEVGQLKKVGIAELTESREDQHSLQAELNKAISERRKAEAALTEAETARQKAEKASRIALEATNVAREARLSAEAELEEVKQQNNELQASLAKVQLEKVTAITKAAHAVIPAADAAREEAETVNRVAQQATGATQDTRPVAEAEFEQAQRAPTQRLDHGGEVQSAAFGPNGKRIVSAGEDQNILVWTLGSKDDPLTLTGHDSSVWSVRFSPDGRRIVSASSDGTVRVWKSDGVGDPLVLRGHKSRVWFAVFSPDGERIASASSDGTVRVWNADGSEDPIVLSGHDDKVMSVNFSPDGKRIVSASSDGTVRIWSIDSDEDPRVITGHDGAVLFSMFSPDGRRVLSTGGDGTIRVWPVEDIGDPLILKGHEGWIKYATFDPDGNRIVSGSSDGTARVWDANNGANPVVFEEHNGAVLSTEFSPDGRWIASASVDGTVRIWSAESGNM